MADANAALNGDGKTDEKIAMENAEEEKGELRQDAKELVAASVPPGPVPPPAVSLSPDAPKTHLSDRIDHSLESTPPRWPVSPELTSWLPSPITVGWLTPLMRLGYKQPLAMDDLYPLRPDSTAEAVGGRFEKSWDEQLGRLDGVGFERYVEIARQPKEQKPKKLPNGRDLPSLFSALWATFGSLFMVAGVFRALSDACSLASPMVLKYLLEVVATGGSVPGRSKGFGFAMGGTLFAVQVR